MGGLSKAVFLIRRDAFRYRYLEVLLPGLELFLLNFQISKIQQDLDVNGLFYLIIK